MEDILQWIAIVLSVALSLGFDAWRHKKRVVSLEDRAQLVEDLGVASATTLISVSEDLAAKLEAEAHAENVRLRHLIQDHIRGPVHRRN